MSIKAQSCDSVKDRPQPFAYRDGTPTILEAIQAKILLRQRNRMHEEAAAAARKPKKPATRRPYARNVVDLSEDDTLRGRLLAHLPRRPYCADDPREGLVVRPAKKAIQYRHIQLNGPAAFEWLSFDVDRSGAYYADADANMPPANIITVNRENGHAHLNYLLASPVLKHDYGTKRPLDYLAAIQRGMTNRMDADRHFGGLMLKNPLHPDWLVEFRRQEPYTLDELNDSLFDSDKRFEPRAALWGVGRNHTVFDDLRRIAYREVRTFKKLGMDRAQFRSRLDDIAAGINLQFETPLDARELRAIVRSVANWTWARYSEDSFSKWASRQGKAGLAKRWAGHISADITKPWEAVDLSRATYYRQQAQAPTKVLSPDTAIVSRVGLTQEVQPWVALGISRNTYYRRKKAGAL